MKNAEYAVPAGLKPLGYAAWLAITDLLRRRKAMAPAHDSGSVNNRIFYTPEEWATRNEKFGANSLLVITHDGGQHAGFFNGDYAQVKNYRAMVAALEPLGLYFEECTSWYSAVYSR